MNRILKCLIPAVLVLVLLCGASMALADGDGIRGGGQISWELNDQGVLTISGTGAMGNYNSYSNFAPWYDQRGSIQSVVISGGVTSVGDYAFSGCTNLTSVTIAEGVTSIGVSSFVDCRGLERITLPGTLKSIGANAFNNCSAISEIHIPGLETWLSIDFANIGSHPETSSWDLWAGEDRVTEVTFPADRTGIEQYLFDGCTSLTSVIIPEGVTSIGECAFEDCVNLSSITIPGTLESIGSGVFSHCEKISEIHVASIGSWLSINYMSETSHPNSNYDAGTWDLYIGDNKQTDLTIPDGVDSIGDYAFYHCSSLTSVTIGEDVTAIGGWSFADCPNLESVSMPESLETIGGSAFRESGLTSVQIPGNVTRISFSVFYDCTSLMSVTFHGNVTEIGDFAFRGCTSLTNLILPENLTSIGGTAFYGCTSLKSVTIPEKLTRIGSGVFSGCRQISEIHISSVASWLSIQYSSDSSHPNYASSSCRLFTGEDELTKLIIPEGTTSIGPYAFCNCSGLTSVCIPESVTSIGNEAFKNCTGLTGVTLPENTTHIGDSAFDNCTGLRSVFIPEGVTSIGNYALARCSSLPGVTIPASVTDIGAGAFFQESGLLAKAAFLGQTCSPGSDNAFGSVKPVIYCYEESEADTWAKEHGCETVYFDGKTMDEIRTVTLPGELTLFIGSSLQMMPEVFPWDSSASIVWQNSNPDVLTLEDGLVTGVAEGDATITASFGSVSAETVVHVCLPLTVSPPEAWIAVGDTVQLTADYQAPEGEAAEITWESGDTSLATVDQSGLVTTRKTGTVVITASAGEKLQAQSTLHLCYPVDRIEFEDSRYTVEYNGSLQLYAHVTTREDGAEYVNKLVSFASSDEAVLEADADGKITACHPGTVTVTATASNGTSASVLVTVLCENENHTPEEDPFESPTQETGGWTAGSHCIICGLELVPRTQIPSLGEMDTLRLPANLKVIESQAFSGLACEAIILPDGCTTVCDQAFENCRNLIYAYIPASVTGMNAEEAFSGCENVILDIR